ncbi:class I SAM-dependent methyltransferase [Nocardia iowensis]|uniref:Class I SAM-dependent methyltransferase n=1 Tax=Nocardia iowensis TaxID=204891 RepID=A0ABX8RVU4_NOCIO|nr:class I SAM-dependent methyltransferase [Nocardia iowensis]QXN92465.1 class I SAM-dependent methyltransferase [Nocardia iowensis]
MGNTTDREASKRALHARRATSFGAHATDYAEHRPDYPLAAIRWALEPIPTIPAPVVLDLGAGTGKLTEGLLAAGATVIAVEPDDGMRVELMRRLPGVRAYEGTAEEIPLAAGSVDAIVAGQAFHWFDQNRAFPEFARVLRKGGIFAALWNTDDMRVEWVAELARVARSDASAPPPEPGGTMLPEHPLFEVFERAEFPHAQRRTADSLAATIGTHSHTLVVSPQQRAEVLRRITDYLHTRPETAEGEFDLPLVTLVLRAALRAAD